MPQLYRSVTSVDVLDYTVVLMGIDSSKDAQEQTVAAVHELAEQKVGYSCSCRDTLRHGAGECYDNSNYDGSMLQVKALLGLYQWWYFGREGIVWAYMGGH